MNTPIPRNTAPSWEHIGRIPIKDNGEPLVPLDLLPERLVVHPTYFLGGIPGSTPQCLARESVQAKLVEVANQLPNGLRLVILDAWRPTRVQQYLFDTLRNVLRQGLPDVTEDELRQRVCEFVAAPSKEPTAPSPHLTGGSVDITLCDDKGRFLPMGSAFDEIRARSHTHELETTDDDTKARDNRRLLHHVMTQAGFTNLTTEWWHFDFGNHLWAGTRGEACALYGLIQPKTTAERWRRQLCVAD